jgi:hypothetical protein
MTRFELATPRPPDVCATGLRYIPKKLWLNAAIPPAEEPYSFNLKWVAKVIENFNFKNYNLSYLSATFYT